MKTITIRMENDEDAALLKKFLSTTKFQSEVEAIEEDEDLTEEELRIVEERWASYETNPNSFLTVEEFNEELKKKYGK